MRCLTGTAFVLVVISETLLAAVLTGNNLFGDDEVEESNYMTSRFRTVYVHNHRSDSAYSGIFIDDDDTQAFKELNPSNILVRMKILLEKMDHDSNGYIDKKELSEQLMAGYRKLSAEEADSEFISSDRNDDDFVTWKEYIGDNYYNHELENDLQEDKALFFAADSDKDGQLNELEFRYFYTPEDYPHMKATVLSGLLNRFDIDKDGNITFDEFVGERKKGHSDNWVEDENYKFNNILDVNKNGVLDENEIYEWASPTNSMIAESEAESLILKADKNRDGTLSFSEILENYSIFISPDSEGYYMFKDEL